LAQYSNTPILRVAGFEDEDDDEDENEELHVAKTSIILATFHRLRRSDRARFGLEL
jgi:hypothetical protein